MYPCELCLRLTAIHHLLQRPECRSTRKKCRMYLQHNISESVLSCKIPTTACDCQHVFHRTRSCSPEKLCHIHLQKMTLKRVFPLGLCMRFHESVLIASLHAQDQKQLSYTGVSNSTARSCISTSSSLIVWLVVSRHVS